MCTINLHGGRHSQVSVWWQSEGPPSGACPMLCRTLVHSPGTALWEAGAQPGLNYIGIRDAGSWWAETCLKVERSNLDIQDPAGPSLPSPSRNNKKSSRSPQSLAEIFRMDTGKKIWDITARTKDEKRGHVHAHQFPTGTEMKWKASWRPSTSNWSMNIAANWEQSWLPPLHLETPVRKTQKKTQSNMWNCTGHRQRGLRC